MSIWKAVKQYLLELEGISEESLIAMIKGIGGKVSASDLSELSFLSPLQAEKKLNLLYAKGILEREFNYPLRNNIYHIKHPHQYAHVEPQVPQPGDGHRGLTDAEVILAALQSEGKLDVASLSKLTGVEKATAEQKLTLLLERQVFRLEEQSEEKPLYYLNNLESFRELIDDAPSAGTP